MKVKFLGTAAAEGFPGLFCECEYCEKARQLRGKNLRARHGALISDKYMIDFSADSLHYAFTYNLNYANLEAILVTHSHDDHFYGDDLQYRNLGYAYYKENTTSPKMLKVFGNDEVKKRFLRVDDVASNIEYNEIHSFDSFEVGDLKVKAVKADHKKGEDCVFYIIEENGKTLLYASDTGYFFEDTWEEVLKHKYDLVITECTFMLKECEHGHMGFSTAIKVKERLEREGCITGETPYYLTHFSHNGNCLHDDFQKIASPHGITIAYDGLEVEV